MSGLTVYQELHLLPAYRQVAPRLLPAFVTATEAHLVGLSRTGVLAAADVRTLLDGLAVVAHQVVEDPLPAYDGTFEDAYYVLERLLAAQLEVPTSALPIQTARSRNDLDAAVFRLLLRDDLLEVGRALARLSEQVLARAAETTDAVIIGYTHRRPAQPTTIAHVLAGFAEALTVHQDAITAQLHLLGASPLGACAFAGSDLPLDRTFLAETLGFERLLHNSYNAVAGADVYGRDATVLAELAALTARIARTALDWLTAGWVRTPEEFCQGSSIMPQKRNPVVLEHLASYAGQTVADAQAVLSLIALSWWEDSNNATTDVQARLWEAADRVRRSVALLGRFFEVFEVGTLPGRDEIVATGATATAVADALTGFGVPFRRAHDITGALTRAASPDTWTPALIAEAVAPAGLGDDAVAAAVAALEPGAVLRRTQADGPGAAAVTGQVEALSVQTRAFSASLDGLDQLIATASAKLRAASVAVGS